MAIFVKCNDFSPHIIHEYGGKNMSAALQTPLARTTIEKSSLPFVPDWVNQFYQSKKVEGVSAYALRFYKQQLGHFSKLCEGQFITRLDDVIADVDCQF
jgi:hypothetical protein